jgi:hypothetical protein
MVAAEAAMSTMGRTVLDTFGKLYAHGKGIRSATARTFNGT